MKWDILDSIEAHTRYGVSLSTNNPELQKQHDEVLKILLKKRDDWVQHLKNIDSALMAAEEERDQAMYDELDKELGRYLETVKKLEELSSKGPLQSD